MNNDLKIIKKKFGEEMSHLCRELFPTLLEIEGLLPNLLLDNFQENRSLCQDIKSQNAVYEFKNYIYSLTSTKESIDDANEITINSASLKNPVELMEEAGYVLKECFTEEEIQEYKKYYKFSEKLCTFNGGRLNSCRVFFAVKKDANEIKRSLNPSREDEYGTSVISIQFTRNDNYLSIKNRYNHSVDNPDATFDNNLDNIIPGLTESFEKHYGLKQKTHQGKFLLPNYVWARDGKLYKYNYEINNIYYCPNNVILNNFEPIFYDKSRYILIDYFLIDLVKKEIILYDNNIQDDFINSVKTPTKIVISASKDEKTIEFLTAENQNLSITVDKNNRIKKLNSNNIKEIGDNFLLRSKYITEIVLDEVENIGDKFLYWNENLIMIKIPQCTKIGNEFLYYNKDMINIMFESVQNIGNDFMAQNKKMETFNAPNVIDIGDNFLVFNETLKTLIIRKIKKIGNSFLKYNITLKILDMPELQIVGYGFIEYNDNFEKIYMPNVYSINRDFLANINNDKLNEFGMHNLIILRNKYIEENTKNKISLFKKLREKISKNYLNNQTEKDEKTK